MDPNLVSNKNFGEGRQENFPQIGGSHNVQYNADIINYHGERVQEPTRTSPPPSSTVPFHRDPNFVDRPELETLEEKLSVWNKKVALVGIGGVGKSQLAIESCYRVRERSPEVWTFWVHASSAARFDADIRKLACDAGIPGWNDPKSDAFALVYGWLRDERNGKWILVLDNVDDASFLFEKRDENDKNARIRMAYLPPCAHGSTLITSRSRAATARLTDECNIIVVNRMGEAAALALLEKKLGQSPAVEDMQKLADALDYMPLALAQAGAYIKQRGSRYSVAHYLTQLKNSEKSQTRLLTWGSKELRRDEEAQDSIILTWQISFDTIRATRPSAADLLSLMSMYNYQGIPEYLVRTKGSGTKPSARTPLGPNDARSDIDASPSASDDEDLEEDEFRDDISTLENFLFISTTFSNVAFEMHPLLQLAARVWLRSHELYQEWARKAIEQLNEALPDGDYENWGRCGELYPHVQCTLGLQLDDREASLRRATIQYKAAWFDSKRGLYSKAKELAASCHNMRRRTLGLEDKETLEAQDVYAGVLWAQGNYNAAEELYRRALKVSEKALGKEHPDTLTSVNNLAGVLQAQGDYEAAEKLYRRALEGSEKVLEKEHPDILASVNNLAEVLQVQGDYEAAEKLHRRALEGLEKVLGKEHPSTLTSVNNLAGVLQAQGDYEVAERLHRRALEGSEKVLGKEHPDTLTSVHNLAGVLQDQGDYEAAEKLYRRALEGLEKVLGKEHPDTLKSVRNLAGVLRVQGDYEAAEKLYRRALQGSEKELGHADE
ncbi:hypothetical protein KC343_g110 [Hortaea werneckii]|nr:hypothetical protein KC352_g4516 [Hortaea werneckii]KAI7572417.1 hypothetical protein KC317_g777 [Hortaea werneckii]KAI7628563.1 hypothetical protein KC346_g101 [Hortaea werneckii]KAI7638378.1 hypothetical protein KC343_g110 [Hortaea werneckii]KAI7684092.1 hypothetical protein KC319_g112 [Hortaea werneckii]